jgi:L-ribulokinase
MIIGGSMANYTSGIVFCTESRRAVLVDVSNGRELATSFHPHVNGVIDKTSPSTEIRLEPDWAL